MKKLNSTEIALLNIKNKSARSTSLIVLTFLLSFILFTSGFLIYSLKGGTKSLANRLGADIILVPEGYDAKVEGSILRGEPSSFFMDEDLINRVKKLEGVKEVTPQLFLATMPASCCSFPVQLIGFDEETDFLVKPWLESQGGLPLNDHEVVAGYNVIGSVDEEVKFFDQKFKIKARLLKTGMGFDNTVFLNMNTARILAEKYKEKIGLDEDLSKDKISSIMIKIDQAIDANDIQNAIRKEFRDDGVFPILSKSMINEIRSSMENIFTYIYVLIALVLLLIFLILFTAYSMSLKERKREFATLRILGAKKKLLNEILIKEVLMLNAFGAVLGSIAALFVSILFSNWFSESFKMPFLTPSFVVLFIILLLVFTIVMLTAFLSVIVPIMKMNKEELALLLKEND